MTATRAMPSGPPPASVRVEREQHAPGAALAAKDAKKRSVHDASWCVADVAHASASVARADVARGKPETARAPFAASPRQRRQVKVAPRAAAPPAQPRHRPAAPSAAHCASAPSVVPAASACSGRGRSSDTNVGAFALRHALHGDDEGDAERGVAGRRHRQRQSAARGRRSTPFTAASGMHGAMILSCAATVAYIAEGSPGDVTRAMASAATNATAPTQNAAAATLVASRVAFGEVQNVRRAPDPTRRALRARRHPLGREDGREDAVQLARSGRPRRRRRTRAASRRGRAPSAAHLRRRSARRRAPRGAGRAPCTPAPARRRARGAQHRPRTDAVARLVVVRLRLRWVRRQPRWRVLVAVCGVARDARRRRATRALREQRRLEMSKLRLLRPRRTRRARASPAR